MNRVAVSSQIRIWQDHNRYAELKGKYVRFVFSDFDKVTIELPLDKHHVVGGQYHLTNRMSDLGWEAVRDLQTRNGRKVSDYFVAAGSRAFIQIPSSITSLQEFAFLVVPVAHADRHNLVVGDAPEPEAPAEAAAAGPAPPIAGDDDDEVVPRNEWYDRGADWKANVSADHSKRTPVFQIESVRLAWHLNCVKDVGDVCRLAARIVAPQLDVSNQPFLNSESMRDAIIKLDLIHMLSCRVFRRPLDPAFRTARYLMADSSPQGRWDYFCCVEEIMRRPLPLVVTIDMDPFYSFTWERRSLPVQTIGRKKAVSR